MSDYEAEARYEHTTTYLNWFPSDDEPPTIEPPNDDPGWMLFSQQASEREAFHKGCLRKLVRILCVWRRRLTRPRPVSAAPKKAWREPAPRVKVDSREVAEMAAEKIAQAERERLADERREAERKRQHEALVASLPGEIEKARLRLASAWESIRGIPGVIGMAWHPPKVERDWSTWRISEPVVAAIIPRQSQGDRAAIRRQVKQATKIWGIEVLIYPKPRYHEVIFGHAEPRPVAGFAARGKGDAVPVDASKEDDWSDDVH